MSDRPDNSDTPEQRKVREAEVSKAFLQYLSGMGDFADFDATLWEETNHNTNPIPVWDAFTGSRHLKELAEFAITILNIIAIKPAASLFCVTMTFLTTRTTKIQRTWSALVSSREGWQTQMAKWIGDSRAAERVAEASEPEDGEGAAGSTLCILDRLPAWKPLTLAILFGGAEKPRTRKPSMEEEERLMEAFAEAMETKSLTMGQ
ncbi:hypothetical protein B0H17DRAFT_1210360 [Mycena rosella]|uniref:Uncharacterized protein n=1 Tax=Mycena rosella TaxID=1033263 RepID=A0AAD7CWE6_MYCRO|nr:hypothetical protein B0H17DRAFT_1210360 [Mycena rosella]